MKPDNVATMELIRITVTDYADGKIEIPPRGTQTREDYGIIAPSFVSTNHLDEDARWERKYKTADAADRADARKRIAARLRPDGTQNKVTTEEEIEAEAYADRWAALQRITYTAKSLAGYLGMAQPDGRPSDGFMAAFNALALMERGLLDPSAIPGLGVKELLRLTKTVEKKWRRGAPARRKARNAADKERRGAAGENLEVLNYLEAGEVCAQDLLGCGGPFREDDMRGTATQRFDAYCAGACIEIEERSALNARSQHIEQGFAQAVAGWACGKARRRFKRSRPICPGNDPHRQPAYASGWRHRTGAAKVRLVL